MRTQEICIVDDLEQKAGLLKQQTNLLFHNCSLRFNRTALKTVPFVHDVRAPVNGCPQQSMGVTA